MRTIAITISIIRTTEKAVLAEAFDGTEVKEIWIPRSLIEDGDEVEPGLSQDIEVAQWFVEKESIG